MSQPEDVFLEQLKVKLEYPVECLEYPVECAKDILNHSGQDMKNVNCDLIDIKEEFTYLELENKVEGKYEDIYDCSNQWNILEDNKDGDFIIKTDEGIKDEFKCAEIIHFKKEENPITDINDVHIEPTENVIVAKLNDKSVTSSTFLKRRRKSKISFSCDLCNSSFTTKHNLIIHIRRHSGDKPYQCHQCVSAFSQRSHLTRHTIIHTGERPYQCHHCHVRYTRKRFLINHMKFIHMKILNRYRCDRCPAKCVSQENLIRHIERRHLVDEIKKCNKKKQRPECYHCGNTFCNKLILVSHMRRHTGGERPYKCDQCDAKFALKSSLPSHMKIHTGEKHQCRYCTVKFTYKGNRVVHERIHTNERPYRCVKCIARFTQKTHLKTHMKTHTNEGPNMCSKCKVGFHGTFSLNRHRRIHELEDASNSRRQFSGKLKN